MIFHENRLLADDSHEISYLIFFQNIGKMLQNLLSAAVVIDALRVETVKILIFHIVNDLNLICTNRRYSVFKL